MKVTSILLLATFVTFAAPALGQGMQAPPMHEDTYQSAAG